MADVVVLGAGVSGHTAALHLRRMLPKQHTVTVVSPNSQWNWIPSNIWVGIGQMSTQDVTFPLAPIYQRKGIVFHQAKATVIRPEGTEDDPRGAVEIEFTNENDRGDATTLRYDYLINATGPQLRFGATKGLGPDGHSMSVCTADHAVEAAAALRNSIEKMQAGTPQTLVIGMGHGTCTCEGAAFEYVFNVEDQVRKAGVRDLATIIYLTNEAQLGDFGVGGMTFEGMGFETNSELWTQSIFKERGVKAILGAHVQEVAPNLVRYETLDGSVHELPFDFAMLLPPFGGVPLKAYDRSGADISENIFAPSGFMKVDANYSPKPFEEWSAEDWPKTYECVGFSNVFAVGIAFAPPHQISRPLTNPNGTVIAPAPPRTGMPSGVMGRAAATTIAKRIKHGAEHPAAEASMADMGAACVASTGMGARSGSAAAMTMYPVVPNYAQYATGRDTKRTRGELGLHGHWVKVMLHYLFIYKAKARFGWSLIPE